MRKLFVILAVIGFMAMTASASFAGEKLEKITVITQEKLQGTWKGSFSAPKDNGDLSIVFDGKEVTANLSGRKTNAVVTYNYEISNGTILMHDLDRSWELELFQDVTSGKMVIKGYYKKMNIAGRSHPVEVEVVRKSSIAQK